MASGTSAKYSLPYPVPTDPNNVPSDVQALVTALEALIATYTTGTPAAGKAGRIKWDGTYLYFDDGTAFHVPATNALSGTARLTTYQQALVDLGSMGTSKALDLSQGTEFKGLLSANCVLSFTNVPSTANTRLTVTLKLTQDSTGSRTVTWPGSVDWGLYATPTLSTTAGKSDLISLVSDDGGTTWLGIVAGLGF